MKFLPNTIINFHAVYNYNWMDSVFCLLKKHYNIISLDEVKQYYYENLPLKNACHITFDDGDQSFYNIVFPLLKKHNIPVSIYVSPQAAAKEGKNFWFQEIRGYDKDILHNIITKSLNKPELENIPVGALLKSLQVEKIHEIIDTYRKETDIAPKPSMNMNTEQLLEIHNSGLVAIGAHTQNHPILSNETDENCEKEIISSIEQLNSVLNTKVEHFAYPNGTPGLDFGSREINILKKAGIKLAFSTENKSFSKKHNPLAIPRRGITYGKQSFILLKLIAGRHWDGLKRLLKGKQESDYRKVAK